MGQLNAVVVTYYFFSIEWTTRHISLNDKVEFKWKSMPTCNDGIRGKHEKNVAAHCSYADRISVHKVSLTEQHLCFKIDNGILLSISMPKVSHMVIQLKSFWTAKVCAAERSMQGTLNFENSISGYDFSVECVLVRGNMLLIPRISLSPSFTGCSRLFTSEEKKVYYSSSHLGFRWQTSGVVAHYYN